MGFQLRTKIKNTLQFCNEFHQSLKCIIKVMKHISSVLQGRMLCKNRWCDFQRLIKNKKTTKTWHKQKHLAGFWPPLLPLGYTFFQKHFRENYAPPSESGQTCINLNAGHSDLGFIFYFLKSHQAWEKDFENCKHADWNIFWLFRSDFFCVFMFLYFWSGRLSDNPHLW